MRQSPGWLDCLGSLLTQLLVCLFTQPSTLGLGPQLTKGYLQGLSPQVPQGHHRALGPSLRRQRRAEACGDSAPRLLPGSQAAVLGFSGPSRKPEEGSRGPWAASLNLCLEPGLSWAQGSRLSASVPISEMVAFVVSFYRGASDLLPPVTSRSLQPQLVVCMSRWSRGHS